MTHYGDKEKKETGEDTRTFLEVMSGNTEDVVEAAYVINQKASAFADLGMAPLAQELFEISDLLRKAMKGINNAVSKKINAEFDHAMASTQALTKAALVGAVGASKKDIKDVLNETNA